MYEIQANSSEKITFLLDDSVKEELTISLAYQTEGLPTFTVLLYSPSGSMHVSTNMSITHIDINAMIVKIQLPGIAEVIYMSC